MNLSILFAESYVKRPYVNLVNQVAGELWVISYIGSLFNFLTLIYVSKFRASVGFKSNYLL
jgi:hypothetical protein